jgi:hypothetical protein
METTYYKRNTYFMQLIIIILHWQIIACKVIRWFANGNGRLDKKKEKFQIPYFVALD